MAALPLPPVAVDVDLAEEVVEVEKLVDDPQVPQLVVDEVEVDLGSDQDPQVVEDDEAELGSDQDPQVVVEADLVGTTVTVV